MSWTGVRVDQTSSLKPFMRIRALGAALASLFVITASCSDSGLVQPYRAGVAADLTSDVVALIGPVPTVRFSELHYDNTGTDANEAIELSGPVGQSLDGWIVVLYNGANGAVYNTRALTGTIPVTCGARGVVVLASPVNGIQNRSPDGVLARAQRRWSVER